MTGARAASELRVSRRAPATRGRLLDAAAVVLARDGLDASMESIADEAGVTRMTLYRNVGTRDQLLVGVLMRASARLAQGITTRLDDRSRPFEARLVDAMVYVVVSVRATPVLRLFVERITPAQVGSIDATEEFLAGIRDLVQPYFDEPEVRDRLRSDPAHSLDWTLRQVLLQLMVVADTTVDEPGLRRELDVFFVPSLLSPP